MTRGRDIRMVAALAASLAAGPVMAGPIYNVKDLGTLGGGSSSAFAINGGGQTAGVSSAPGEVNRAFLYSGSGMTQLGDLPGAIESRASGINNSGAVAGTTYLAGSAQATVWDAGGPVGLGGLGGQDSYAMAINGAGQVAGGAATAAGPAHAFLYSGGTLFDLGTLDGGSWSAAYGVNDSAQVAGYGDLAPGVFHAFRWSAGGGMQDLGTLGGRTSYAFGINQSGTIVGNSTLASGYAHAFVYSGGAMQDLGTLGGGSSYAYGINAAGDVVGFSWLAGSWSTHAFLSRNGVLVDLNDLIPAGSGWLLTQAYGINDSGQITGAGIFEGHERAFRLDRTPTVGGSPGDADSPTVQNPEPGSVTLFALGVAWLGFRYRRRFRRDA